MRRKPRGQVSKYQNVFQITRCRSSSLLPNPRSTLPTTSRCSLRHRRDVDGTPQLRLQTSPTKTSSTWSSLSRRRAEMALPTVPRPGSKVVSTTFGSAASPSTSSPSCVSALPRNVPFYPEGRPRSPHHGSHPPRHRQGPRALLEVESFNYTLEGQMIDHIQHRPGHAPRKSPDPRAIPRDKLRVLVQAHDPLASTASTSLAPPIPP